LADIIDFPIHQQSGVKRKNVAHDDLSFFSAYHSAVLEQAEDGELVDVGILAGKVSK
jgi:hypothetical protein